MNADGPAPKVLLADKGYDADFIREDMERRGGTAMIPTKRNRRVAEPGRQLAAAAVGPQPRRAVDLRSEEHTSELQSLMRISYDVFCLKKKIIHQHANHYDQ